MKRDAYGEEGPAMKRHRQSEDEVTFLIPSRVAGSIIGKGGTNIQKLRSQRPRHAGWPVAGAPRACPRPDRPRACRRGVRRYSESWLPVPPRRTPLPRTRRPATQYKASITVPDCPGPERVLSITAPEQETILDIVRDILPSLADIGLNKEEQNLDEDLDVRLLIHQSRAGCVIGKAGAKIKELREKTGARLKIFSNPAPQSTERVVQLVGAPDAVAAAVREVLDLVREVPIRGAVQNYDPHNYDDFYADEYGGFGNGQGGGGGPRGGPNRGPPRGGPPPRGLPPMGPGGPGGPGGRGPPPPRGGPPMGRNGPPGPRGGFNDYAGPGGPGPRGNFNGPPRGGGFGGGSGNFGGGSNFGSSSNFGGGGSNFGGGGSNFGGSNFGSNFAGGRGGVGGGGGGGNFNNDGNQQETSTQVTIPKDLAGAIIGKAGSRIRKIRTESGAGIEIAEPLPGSSDRIITITGTPQRIQMAQYLLQQRMFEEFPELAPNKAKM